MSDWQEEAERRRAKAENARRAVWNDGRAMDRARAETRGPKRIASINAQLAKNRNARLAADRAGRMSDADAQRMEVRAAMFDAVMIPAPDFEWTAEGRACRGEFDEMVSMVGPTPEKGSVRVRTKVGWMPVTLNHREVAPGVTIVWWGKCSAVLS